MTLNEKFDKATDGWIVADKCEKIADEFAIDFAEWLLKKYNGIKSVKEQLEIYKKEKGL
jgi:hypothetical protein